MTRERVTLEVGRELSVRHPNKLLAAREYASGVEGKLLTLDLSRTKMIRPFGAAMLVAMGYECTPQNVLEITPPEDATALRQMHALGLDRFFKPNDPKQGFDSRFLKSNVISGVPIRPVDDNSKEFFREIVDLIEDTVTMSAPIRQLVYSSIKETVDNVCVHADERSYALVAAHAVKSAQRIRITILDDGQGIYNTLKQSKKWRSEIQNDLEAISYATRKDVTGKFEDRGRGLWLLKRFLSDNDGLLSILSGNGI
ncbi:hypothetical protein GF324_00960, partial [bacterium]|nr:hypothetical protein [bacterium]